MRIFHVFIKAMKEQIRDYLVLSLSLLLAPVFVLFYWLFFPEGGSTTYDLLIINHDQPLEVNGTVLNAGEDLISNFSKVTYSDGQPILKIELIDDLEAGLIVLKDHEAELLMVIPETFSQSVQQYQDKTLMEASQIELYGDLTYPYYAVAAVMASAGMEEYMAEISDVSRPYTVAEYPIGDSAGRSEFEIYVPGMLMFSVVLLVFQTSMVISYEVESGTFQRLKMSGVTSFEYLAGTSLSLLLIGVVSIVLAFIAAVLLGFNSQGPIWAAILVGSITCVSVIGIGLMIAAFTKTVAQSFIVANFPLVIMMFFTGVIYPIEGVNLFTIAGKQIGLFDILPPTHAVKALNKILTLGSGLEEVWFELTALAVLSVLYFLVGVFLFNRRQMRD